jgi:hypothetical protein
MNDLRPPANAFEWRRYVVEEDARRGIVPSRATLERNRTLARQQAATETLERIRETKPLHGMMIMSPKRSNRTDLKPKEFIVYNRVRKNEGK